MGKEQLRHTEIAMPQWIAPMKPSLTREPIDMPGWWYEIKWNGYRGLARVQDHKVSLLSKQANPFTPEFSSIEESLRRSSANVILDGEIVVIDNEAGIPNLNALKRKEESQQALYIVFDLLHYAGVDTTKFKLRDRKALLRGVVGELGADNVVFCQHVESGGLDYIEEVRKLGQEGVVIKNPDSQYLPGKTVKSWKKFKFAPSLRKEKK